MSFQYVPTVDFLPYLQGSNAGKHATARAVAAACRDIGFLILQNHGVDQSLIDETMHFAKAFFALPLDEKMQVQRPAPQVPRGYSPIATESVSYGSSSTLTPGDLKESFDIGPLAADADDPYFTGPAGGAYFAANLWPERPRELRALWPRYYTAMERLARQLMRVFALGLDLDERYFDRTIDRHISVLRAINYPEQAEAPVAGQLRAGEHSDYGSLTILASENAPGGLQVKNSNEVWVDVPFIEQALVVNIGDLMMRWTNDTWRSTRHRVVNPPRAQAMRSRLSLVFFHQPNYDALVECIPTCSSDARPARYPPITSGDHLLSNFTRQTTFAEQA